MAYIFTLFVKPLMLFFGSLKYHARNHDSLVGVTADGGGRGWLPWLQAESRQKHINLGLTGFIYIVSGEVASAGPCYRVGAVGGFRRSSKMVLLSCHSGAQAQSPTSKVYQNF